MRSKTVLAAASCLFLGTGGMALAHGVDDPLGHAAEENAGLQTGPKPQLTQTVLEFQRMLGVDGQFRAPFSNPIRGIHGGGLPWVLGGVKGELKDDGKLEVQVSGLVIPADDAPAACNGIACNPAPFFRAVVSCLTIVWVPENIATIQVSNFSTDNGDEVMIGDPKDGNAKIEAALDLPDPCLAPLVFVTNDRDINDPEQPGVWFAVTGVGTI